LCNAAEPHQALAPDLTLADCGFPEALSGVVPAPHLHTHAAVVLDVRLLLLELVDVGEKEIEHTLGVREVRTTRASDRMLERHLTIESAPPTSQSRHVRRNTCQAAWLLLTPTTKEGAKE